MTELPTKDITTVALASITTGRMLCGGKIDPIHEAIEWLMGHPVWTHEIPRFLPAAKEEALRQFPDLPLEMDRTKGGMERNIAEVQARYGVTVSVQKGQSERTVSPIQTAMEVTERVGAKLVIVEVGEKDE